MSNDIFVIAEHLEGQITDLSYELVGKAKELAAVLGGQSITVLLGNGLGGPAGSFASDSTIYVEDLALEQFNPEAYGKVIMSLVTQHSPRLTIFGSTSMGMDIAAWLSVKTGQPCVAYVRDLVVENGQLVATSRVYAGKMEVESLPEGDQTIVAVMAGAFAADAGKGSTAAQHQEPTVSLDGLRTRFIEMITPDASDIDITAQDKLVAIGRGIASEDNVELAEELAEVLGATVAASRPVTDAGWLPKTRQVGKSGLTVKPKLYLMLGISGAPEHLEGMKGAELIIAVNTDENAPIFDVADYGTTEDLFDVAEAMLEALE